jgi:aminoglycoside phosphotransferase (APT) family kinase protein
VKMHADQVDLSPADVAALLAAQFPQWSGLPVRPLASDGTVNAMFRAGDELLLRFPLRPDADAARQQSAQDHARRITPFVPVAVPEPLGLGGPGDGYPGWWSVYRWIPGDHVISDADRFARDLAGFVTALHGIDAGGRTWDGVYRGGPLAGEDEEVQPALARIDRDGRLAAVWAACRDAPAATGDVWIHADLMPGNLLSRDGRLAAVIDLEAMTVGDPAVDLMPAWNMLPAGARDTYRRALGVDDATWLRGQGWALAQAAVALPYYVDTNPAMAATARRTLAAILA